MQLTAGTRLGPYRIDASIGAGGMGEVYRATDMRLERNVAIKILSGELAADPQLHARFDREARAISSLNHSHICALYDIGEATLAGGSATRYLVMEFLDGETLETRLLKGPMPVDQVLRIGIEIADALDKAHRRGIVHRDLKPGNVMLTRAGAKLLDFGLARTDEFGEANADGATQARPLTREGMLVGTYQYMSPEQLEARPADARSDLFALGAVLYEMLTGRRAFEGKSRASIIAAILAGEITPISDIKPMVPPALDRVIRVCLAKDPDERWQTAHDVMLQLRWVAEGGSKAGVAAPLTRKRVARETIAWAVAVLATLAALTAAVAYFKRTPSGRPRVHFSIDVQDRASLYPFDERGLAFSPDGTRLVYAATARDRRRQLFLRPLSSNTPRLLGGTENASYPFWSPDGRSIAFFADGKLKKVAADGGPVQTISDAPSGRGGTWGPDGTILFSTSITSALSRVPSGGGTPVAATVLKGDTRHRWPSFLPDGRRFLTVGDADVFIGELGKPEVRKLIVDGSNAEFVEPDIVVFGRAGTLMSQHIDLKKLEMVGDATPLPIDPVAYWGPKRYIPFTTTRDGAIAFLPAVSAPSRLLWVDRQGRQLDAIGDPAIYQDAILSPDGRTVAVVKGSPAEGDIWLVDLAAQRWSRATFTPGSYGDLTWSWDGSKLAYMYVEKGIGQTYVKALARDDAPVRVTKLANFSAPFSFSPDGTTLLMGTQNPSTQWDLYSAPAQADARMKPLVVTPYTESRARFSPDGKWFVYDSTESGRSEVYVRRFPPTVDQWQISTDGGSSPFWSADGRELYYVGTESLMAVPISGGERLNPGTARALFPVPSNWRAGALLTSGPLGSMVCGVTPDGSRFLFQSTENDRLAPINVIVGGNNLFGAK